jgi:hypothetical protein
LWWTMGMQVGGGGVGSTIDSAVGLLYHFGFWSCWVVLQCFLLLFFHSLVLREVWSSIHVLVLLFGRVYIYSSPIM